MEKNRKNRTGLVTVISVIIVAAVLAGGIILLSRSSHKDASEAARSVSLLYMDELAGRREQVVEDNLNNHIDVIDIAVQMLTDEDLSGLEPMRAYQRRVKQFFHLERFAFVDSAGAIYTADEGIREEADQSLSGTKKKRTKR